MEEHLNKVHNMDCIEFLELLPDNSIHSCVTDPPYGLEFMGKEWDSFKATGKSKLFHNLHEESLSRLGGIKTLPRFAIDSRLYQEWCEKWAKETFRVLKSGAHILSFSGTRTYHRLACAIEDAGFEIRDQVHWLYGSGFPKGLNVSNAIIESQLSEWLLLYPDKKQILNKTTSKEQGELKHQYKLEAGLINDDGSPKIQEAIDWNGWNTQLKPAHEPIVLARKPVSESTIVDNVLKHGTGALNIDATRVSVNPELDDMDREVSRKPRISQTWEEGSGFKNEDNPRTGVLPSGRYPANLILSHHPNCELIKEGNTVVKRSDRKPEETTLHGIYSAGWIRNPDAPEYADTPEIWNCVKGCPVRILNEQSGWSQSSPVGFKGVGWKHSGNTKDKMTPLEWQRAYTDSGGAARFFYCPKPSDTERNRGLKGDRNIHITVKPLELMRWLVRLVTPPGGIVLDPFLGSGTTAIAAENEGFDWVGCELNEEYCDIAKLRIKALGGRQSTIGEFMDSFPKEK